MDGGRWGDGVVGSKGNAGVGLEGRGDGGEEVEGGVEFVFAAGGPGGADTEVRSRDRNCTDQTRRKQRERRWISIGGG